VINTSMTSDCEDSPKDSSQRSKDINRRSKDESRNHGESEMRSYVCWLASEGRMESGATVILRALIGDFNGGTAIFVVTGE